MDSTISSQSSRSSTFVVHLTFEQKLQFVNMLEPDKKILFGNLTKDITALARAARWREIFDELMANEFGLKSVEHLKTVVWGNIRKEAKKKFENNRQTGAALMPYNDVDRVALDIMNTKSASLIGLGASDRAPTFSNRLNNVTVPGSTESVHDLTTESSFNLNLAAGTSASSFSFTVPHAPGPIRGGPRSSSPLLEDLDADMEEDQQDQVRRTLQTPRTMSGPASKKHKGPAISLLFDPAYKSLKFERMRMDGEEQQLRMDLIRAKIKAEDRRAEFFEKASLKLDHQGASLLVRVPNEEDYVVNNI
jgi:hypothetical protein